MQITFVFCVRRYSRLMRCIKDSTDSGAPNKTTASMSPISIPISKMLVEMQMAQAVAPNQTSTSSHCSFVQRRVMRPNRSVQTLPRLQGSGQLLCIAAEICKHQQQIPIRHLFHQAFRKHLRFPCSCRARMPSFKGRAAENSSKTASTSFSKKKRAHVF